MKMKDAIELNNGNVPQYWKNVDRSRTRDEELQYSASRNTLIEIEIGAKNGLRLLGEAMEEIIADEQKDGKQQRK